MPSPFLRAAVLLSGLLLSAPAFAADAPVKEVEAYIKTHVMAWLGDKVVIDAVKEQNARNADLTQAEAAEQTQVQKIAPSHSVTASIGIKKWMSHTSVNDCKRIRGS